MLNRYVLKVNSWIVKHPLTSLIALVVLVALPALVLLAISPFIERAETKVGTVNELEVARKTCELLETAFDEAHTLSYAWYEHTGVLLEQECGKRRGTLVGLFKSCAASRVDDTSIDCSIQEEQAYGAD